MAGPDGSEPHDVPLIDQLVARIETTQPIERQELLRTFATLYLKRLPDADVPDLEPDQLLAEIADLFDYIDQRELGVTALRIYRPTEADSGYTTPGSVIQIVADDSPFLVDSMLAAVDRFGVEVVRHLHPMIGTDRNPEGRLTAITRVRGGPHRESVQHFELARELDEDEIKLLSEQLHGALRDVAATVRDFEPMRDAVRQMSDVAKASVHTYDYEEIAETVAFLDWLLDDNFVFLGFREYEIGATPDGEAVSADPDSGLGILSANGAESSVVLLDDLPPHLQDRYRGGSLLVITKTNRHATVHRDARMDYVSVRRLDTDGRMVGELRMLGLFTSKAYMTPAGEIPVLRRKLRQVIASHDVIEGSHDYKSLIAVFETFPKDDLFAMEVESLTDMLGELVETEESSEVRLFIRRDALNRYVSILVTVPRDRFNADLRKQMQELFLTTYGGHAIDYRLALGESGDARIHFSVWVEEGAPLDVDVAALEHTVITMARNWDDRVVEELMRRVGEHEAKQLGATWASLFPSYYKTSTGIDIAAGDILHLDQLAASGADVGVGIQNETDAGKSPVSAECLTRITVYRSSGKLNLSEMMPLMEHLGLTVVEEVPTRLRNEEGTFIHDFGVLASDGALLDVDAIGSRIGDAIRAVLEGDAESDSLHRLLVSSDLSHDELTVLRAYRAYWRLVTPAFSVGYVDDALSAHPDLAQQLVRLFEARFDGDHDGDACAAMVARIEDGLNSVASLDEDRILRGFLGLILATERTNVHVPGRRSLALKFRSAAVPEMPAPVPMFEIFVYSGDVEGVHLRGGMVARGGIRWSDRREDYRTEVLGLMKAQMTKNVVIVPTGAKGGFVLKGFGDSAPTYDEVRSGYETFIRGLLDVTDNRVGDSVIGPEAVTRHDPEDPYLVVAADKGTATFSDAANDLAAEYGFWLDDAFASGGSAGYDHKALGITARGAWESVRRHFLDMGIDVGEDEITAVGIGDMSGDVFGNGMLLSPHLRLVAAFDHRHIFVDPAPDAASSFAERQRLAHLDRSSWEDYDETLISSGGGVFPRTAKRIELTDEIRSALGSDVVAATPNELIRLILTAPVDLLWNGGIGTYVKSRDETNAEVQDRSNDAVRVDGRDLRCRVVGEGGNLGLTQLGRIEFDRAGGRVFADFVDNSGGVHASDREVNIKILLRMAEEAGEITRTERDEIIESVSGDVVDAILYDNFLQAQIISQEQATSPRMVEAYADLMDRLEREGILDRDTEFLPHLEEMAQRGREGRGMTRPEIAVLLSYAKMSLTEHLRMSDLPDDPHFEGDLLAYFPPSIVERFRHHIVNHPLRRDLISTIVANQVLNSQGSTYYSRLRTVSGASAAMIVRAYRMARAVTRATDRWRDVEALAADIAPHTSRLMLQDIDRLVTVVSRWYLRNPTGRTIDEEIAATAADFARLAEEFPSLGLPEWRATYDRVAADLVDVGVPEELAVRHAYQRALRRGPDIVDLSHRFDQDIITVAEISTRVSQQFRIGWLERQIRLLPGTTAFDRLAIEALRDDLQQLRRDVVATVLDGSDASFDRFLERHDRIGPRIERWYRWLSRDGILDVSGGMVASRRLRQILLS